MDPVEWDSIRDTCKAMLTPSGLEKYQELYEEEEDLHFSLTRPCKWRGAACIHQQQYMHVRDDHHG
jgi:hypothetical protein